MRCTCCLFMLTLWSAAAGCNNRMPMCIGSFSLHSKWIGLSKRYPNSSVLRRDVESDRLIGNVSGYVCNHGSPNGERDTASPRGRYGERLSVTRVWRYIFKNTTCWPATAHDVTTGVPQYKCRREDTSSASSSEACVRSMVQSLGDAVSRSPFGEPWLHT